MEPEKRQNTPKKLPKILSGIRTWAISLGSTVLGWLAASFAHSDGMQWISIPLGLTAIAGTVYFIRYFIPRLPLRFVPFGDSLYLLRLLPTVIWMLAGIMALKGPLAEIWLPLIPFFVGTLLGILGYARMPNRPRKGHDVFTLLAISGVFFFLFLALIPYILLASPLASTTISLADGVMATMALALAVPTAITLALPAKGRNYIPLQPAKKPPIIFITAEAMLEGEAMDELELSEAMEGTLAPEVVPDLEASIPPQPAPTVAEIPALQKASVEYPTQALGALKAMDQTLFIPILPDLNRLYDYMPRTSLWVADEERESFHQLRELVYRLRSEAFEELGTYHPAAEQTLCQHCLMRPAIQQKSRYPHMTCKHCDQDETLVYPVPHVLAMPFGEPSPKQLPDHLSVRSWNATTLQIFPADYDAYWIPSGLNLNYDWYINACCDWIHNRYADSGIRPTLYLSGTDYFSENALRLIKSLEKEGIVTLVLLTTPTH